ncbi:MAG: FG-GAP-like repeat-containing protein [Candidatus Eisenbacteria bacterium]
MREYQASRNSEGLQAPNRAHDLRTYFEPAGIRIVDRAASEPTELLALRLERVGRAGRMESVAAGAVRHERARVEIRRQGLVEWYENSPAGLEQGFTLEARPMGDGPVIVEIAVHGANVSEAGDAATFASHSGRQLQYGKLVVFDAGGAPLAASMEANDGVVRLVVNDAGAAYPITIDPLITSTHDTQLAVSQASGWFGHQAASAGDVNGDGYDDVIVGALMYAAGQTNEGAAIIYLGSATGIPNNATPATTLEGNESNAVFAYVSGAGDVNGDGYADVIVGATGLAAYQGGSAHIYHGSATGIPNGNPVTDATTLHSTTSGNYFGLCVASAGGVNGDGYADVIVGASGSTGLGAAYVLHGSASGVASAHVSAAATALTCTQAAAEFGRSAAGAGERLAWSMAADAGSGRRGRRAHPRGFTRGGAPPRRRGDLARAGDEPRARPHHALGPAARDGSGGTGAVRRRGPPPAFRAALSCRLGPHLAARAGGSRTHLRRLPAPPVAERARRNGAGGVHPLTVFRPSRRGEPDLPVAAGGVTPRWR